VVVAMTRPCETRPAVTCIHSNFISRNGDDEVDEYKSEGCYLRAVCFVRAILLNDSRVVVVVDDDDDVWRVGG